MKKQGFLAATVSVVAIFSCSLQLRAQTAEEMLSACRPIVGARISDGNIDMPQTFDAGSCWGAFGALQQVAHLYEGGKPALHTCVPSNTTRTELIAIFVRYVREHPKVYPQNFAWVAENAMISAFPCKSAP